MKRKTLIFLKPFTKKNATTEEKTDFLVRENVNEMECASLGMIFGNDELYGKDIKEFIRSKISELKPEWVIAEGESATVVLELKEQKKVLINPKVSSAEGAENVPASDADYTFGFFDQLHEADYERFQMHYPHASLIGPGNLCLFMIKEIVETIVESGEW